MRLAPEGLSMRHKKRRMWTSLTAAATLVPAAAAALSVSDGSGTLAPHAVQPGKPALPPMVMAEGGEGGEGGAGGEGGVDPARAGEDPVLFLTALDIIAAHYHAGLAAYLAGDHTAGAEMFAHPIGEVYIDLSPIVTALGAADFGPQMQKASDIALAGASDAEVTAAVQGVFDALAATAAKAPAGTASKESVDAAVLAEMLNRAALQYQSALTAETNEPFLDGFGYFEAAKARAKRVLPVLEASDPGAADATGKAISALATAYPGIAKPKTAGIAAGEAIAATSRAMLVLTAH